MIGYYVHHHGRGHLEMARCVTVRLTGNVTGLSSLARPAGWPGQWLTLPRDDAAEAAIEPTAHGQLHWVPLGDQGLRNRMAAIAGWIQRAAPSVIVVDVSVEVAALARLMGVPVVSVVLPGRRGDLAHRLGHALTEALIAPWPASLPGVLLDVVGAEADKIRHVGAFSRFDGRAPEPGPAGRRGALSVVVLSGSGGSEVTGRHLRRAAAATPGWAWTILGGTAGQWAEDPWPALCRADVVITHGGLNAVAEVAAARKPAVVVPQDRPHGEQRATARALAQAGLAVIADPWPQDAAWPSLLRAARELGGARWAAWSTGTGAQDAAQIIESIGAHQPGRDSWCAARS
jgi:Glycosyltransferase family 28 C-terminal domain